jgi:hypothetical protein
MKTYIQLNLFEDSDCGIKNIHILCPSLLDVINYFISINTSIDPVWWACRWSDMIVYTTILNPNQKPKGCMAQGKQYPFNVWEFIKQVNREDFINFGINQVKKKYEKI